MNNKRPITKQGSRKSGKFVSMVAATFVILFLFAMCGYALLEDNIKTYAESLDNNVSVDGAVSNSNPGSIQTVTTPNNNEDATKDTEGIVSTEEPIIVENTEPEATVNTDTQPENDVTYPDDDLYYLAAAVCREAGGQSEEIQLLVANVIINRVNSDLFPNTIYKVLTQHMQYGTMWRDGISFPSWATEEVKEQCYSVAKRVLDGERFCPENVLFQAEFEQGSGIFKYYDEGYYFCYCGI